MGIAFGARGLVSFSPEAPNSGAGGPRTMPGDGRRVLWPLGFQRQGAKGFFSKVDKTCIGTRFRLFPSLEREPQAPPPGHMDFTKNDETCMCIPFGARGFLALRRQRLPQGGHKTCIGIRFRAFSSPERQPQGPPWGRMGFY